MKTSAKPPPILAAVLTTSAFDPPLPAVTWNDGSEIKLMRSYGELKAEIDSGAITAKEAGVAVNMPFLTWPGGLR